MFASLPQTFSALLPTRLQATFAADGVYLQTLDFLGRAAGTREHLALPPLVGGTPVWQPWVDALQRALAARPTRRFELRVLLSDRFVRYQHLPWRSGIAHRRERQAYASHRFREVYGDLAMYWQIALSDGVPGSASMACAMDKDLLAGLRGLERVRLVSVQPMFVAAYNRARSRCKGGQFWFAHVESDRVCIAMLKGGQGAAVRNEACGENWLQAVADIKRRLQIGDDAPEAPVPVYVSGNLQGVPAPQLLGLSPVHVLT